MQKLTFVFVMLAIIGSVLTGCALKDRNFSKLSEWELKISGSIFGAACNRFSSNSSMDKAEASALARAYLLKNIETKGLATFKALKSKLGNKNLQSAQAGIVTDRKFFRLTLAEELIKEHIKEIDNKISYKDKKFVCVVCVLNKKGTEKVFKRLIEWSKICMDSQEKKILYEKFRSKFNQKIRSKEVRQELKERIKRR